MLRFIGPMLDSADVTPQDGRVARSHRTRAAIVEALVALLEEGKPQPAVEEIAARASGGGGGGRGGGRCGSSRDSASRPPPRRWRSRWARCCATTADRDAADWRAWNASG